VVIAQSWPVWAQSLTVARGFDILAVFTDFERNIEAWDHIVSKDKWHPFSLFIAGFEKDTIYALSGSLDFANIWRNIIPSHASILIGLTLFERPKAIDPPPWKWFNLTHSGFGGVTTGRYWCGTNVADFKAPSEFKSAQRVKHCLKPLVKGPQHRAPIDPEATYLEPMFSEGGLHPGSLFPITSPRQKVLAPCIFSPTKWVL
jgi:hypothetical protein